jgi:hypothetical protein
VTASNSSAERNDALGGRASCSEPRLSRVFLDGRAERPAQPLALQAGPLSLIFDDAGLRYIRFGQREVVRRIYCAARDENWGTVPGAISNLQPDVRDNSFRIEFDIRHVQAEIDFAWHGTICGEPSGRIVFAMDGVANRTFRKNRIGFCVLHPMELAGEAVEVVHADGTREESQFPRYIAPYNPLLEVTALRHAVGSLASVELKFDGDVFETEDQRNWIDASFKTFCTPLARPFPVEVRVGDRVSQSVTIELNRHSSTLATPADVRSDVSLKLAPRSVGPLPKIGFSLPVNAEPFTSTQVERLRALKPKHLRCELRLSGDFVPVLKRAAAMAVELSTELELVLFVGPNAQRDLAALLDAVRSIQPPIARWVIFPAAGWSTTRDLAEEAGRVLRTFDSHIPVGGGTPASFLELNRERPPIELLDFVAWSMQPQEHAFDNASLVETLATQAVTVASAAQFAGGRPLVVGPITLKRRINPYATGAWPPAPPPGELPPQVDVRQLSLFGAGWTLGSVKYLAEAGVSAVTYYELVGWKGLMENDRGSPLPEQFPSLPGGVFPLYHVFADLAELSAPQVLLVCSSDPLGVECLAVQSDTRSRLLVTNFTNQQKTVTIPTIVKQARVRMLDERNAVAAMASPESYRRIDEAIAIENGRIAFTLLPYALARLDLIE